MFISNFNYKDKKIEEMEGQFIIPIARQDGKKFKLETLKLSEQQHTFFNSIQRSDVQRKKTKA